MARCAWVVCWLTAILGPAESRLSGYHVDDESCSGLIQNNRTEQIIVCARFLGQLTALRSELEQYSGDGLTLKLSVDAGTAWSCPPGSDGCFNITFGGKTQSVAAHVVDIADEIVVMDYNRAAVTVEGKVAAYLQHAEAVGKPGVVVVGLALSGWNDPAPPAWQTRSETELEQLMATTAGQLAARPGWSGGFAVFTSGQWQGQSQHAAWSGAFHTASTYYANHTLILRDPAGRTALLDWASSRGITQLYLAPHAGNTALISIPGVEGSPADDAIFCSFIATAGLRGVDVLLISDPTTDAHFLKNCTGPAPRPWSRCEMRDGDCDACRQPLLAGLSPVAKITLSGVPTLVSSAKAAQAVIKGLGNGSDLISFDSPTTGLHTSMFYFCCHTAAEIATMHTVFAALRWSSFDVSYDTAGCNVDTHDNKTVYIHALPANQTALFGWAAEIETALEDAGLPVNHPRRSLFHMTLARVTRAYPTDMAVRAIEQSVGVFGHHRLCSFDFAGKTYSASDC